MYFVCLVGRYLKACAPHTYHLVDTPPPPQVFALSFVHILRVNSRVLSMERHFIVAEVSRGGGVVDVCWS